VINVGAATETEMKEKKARVEDALHATRAGGRGRDRRRRRRGVHPGRLLPDTMKLEHDQQAGVEIVRKALFEPAKQIRDQRRPGRRRHRRQDQEREGNYGYNAGTEEFEDLMKGGILDPTK